MDNFTLNGRIIQAADGGLLVRSVRRTLDAKSSATADLWIPFTVLRVIDVAGKLVIDEAWLQERLGAAPQSYLSPASPEVARIPPPTLVPERSGLVQGHRWLYEQHHGPVPVGLECDHLCLNRSCVRPDLEAVTCRENLLRGLTLPANGRRALGRRWQRADVGFVQWIRSIFGI